MRLEIDIGFYNEDFARCLKWYHSLFSDKHPSKEDEKLFHKLTMLLGDMEKQDREEELEADRA